MIAIPAALVFHHMNWPSRTFVLIFMRLMGRGDRTPY